MRDVGGLLSSVTYTLTHIPGHVTGDYYQAYICYRVNTELV